MRRIQIFFMCVLFFFQVSFAVLAEPVMGPEYDVKIGFIYNFAGFVTWPPSAFEKNPDTLVLCFASDHASNDVFFKLNGKMIHDRKIKVIPYQDSTSLEESHILFFATQNKIFIQDVLELARGQGILTIGEVDGFIRMGGVINFFQERNRLRFKVNIDAVRREGLKMSSQLLGSARIIRDDME